MGVDRESERVVYVNEGKGKQAVQAIGRHLQAKEAQAEQIQQVSVDFSPAFIVPASKLLSLTHRLPLIVSISSSCSIKQWMQCAKRTQGTQCA